MSTTTTAVGSLDNLTSAELARLVEIDRSHASLLLRGRRQPSWELAAKIADKAGVSLDELRVFLASRALARAA